ncbi:hypothetical protein C9975_06310 [Thalassospira xiamenensis]|nr:hypothetical protein C9975_06310 [Thalassospira xiamenensis]
MSYSQRLFEHILCILDAHQTRADMTSTTEDQVLEPIRDSNPTPDKCRQALKIALNVLDRWDLSEEQRLGSLGLNNEAELADYMSSEVVFPDVLNFRISIIIGLHADLKRLFLQKQHQRQWMVNKHKSLSNQSPVDVLCSDDLVEIRRLRTTLGQF